MRDSLMRHVRRPHRRNPLSDSHIRPQLRAAVEDAQATRGPGTPSCGTCRRPSPAPLTRPVGRPRSPLASTTTGRPHGISYATAPRSHLPPKRQLTRGAGARPTDPEGQPTNSLQQHNPSCTSDHGRFPRSSSGRCHSRPRRLDYQSMISSMSPPRLFVPTRNIGSVCDAVCFRYLHAFQASRVDHCE